MKFNRELIEDIAKEDPDLAERLAREWRDSMVVLARHDPSVFCEYVLRNEKTSGPIYQHKDHEEIHATILKNQRTAIWTHPEFGKALPLDTEIPTPFGFRRMEDLHPGDEVFGSDGKPCLVTGESPIYADRDVYELEFDDGVTVRADSLHLWLASNIDDRAAKRKPRVVTTEEMARTVFRSGKTVWSVQLTAPVQYPAARLPVHPYALGAWLGDGSSNCGTLTSHESDRFIPERCAQLLAGVSDVRIRHDPQRSQILRTSLGVGFVAAVRSLGILSQKRIPDLYLQAGIEDRRELLAGLLDTDGCVYTRTQNVSFVEISQVREDLASGILQLVRSLGFKARMRTEDAVLNGRVVGLRHRIFFTAREPVFRLPRKLAKQRYGAVRGSKATSRYIVRISRVESVPTKCIAVDSPDRTFLMGRSYTVTHNCLAAGSRVLLSSNRWVPIESLEGQECELIAWDEYALKLKTVRARVWSDKVVPVVGLEMANGVAVKATADHPFMVDTYRWVRAGDLTLSDSILAVSNLGSLPSNEDVQGGALTEDEALLLGFFVSGRLLGENVIARRVDGRAEYKAQRDELILSAGWDSKPFQRLTDRVSVKETCELSPAGFVRSCCEVDSDGYPVEFNESVTEMGVGRITKLLRGIFATAFHGGVDSEDGRISATIGVGRDRIPEGLGFVKAATAHAVRRLLLRVGINARVFRYHKRLGVDRSGGLFADEIGELKDQRPSKTIWCIRIPRAEIARFWPTVLQPPSITRALAPIAVKGIEKLPAERVWSVEVFDVCHSFLCDGLVTHNTNQVSIGHVLWRIGKDPNLSIAILSNTGNMAAKIISSLKQYIASSPELHDVFPHLKPGDKWSEYAFTVDRTTFRKDPTVQAIGLTGNVVGARLDGLIVDDLDDMDTVRTAEAREHTQYWVRKQALTRLGQDGWCVMIGNVWHENDTMHTLSKSGTWKRLRYPVLLPDGQGDFYSRDPANFPIERIISIRDNDLGPVAFQQLYMLTARADGEQRFREEWINAALEKGRGIHLWVDGIPKTPLGCRTITGVDLGVKKKASSDPTVITTVLETQVDKNRYELQVLNISKGRWNASEIMDEIARQQRLFGSEVWVESNGAQDFIVQLMSMSSVYCPVKSFYTGRNKYDPMFGVESIAAEMSVGLWTLPCPDGTRESVHPYVEELIQEMLAYTPGNHTGDILMSLWIAREAARSSRKTSSGTVQFGRLNLRKR